jgi:hypothetical protein
MLFLNIISFIHWIDKRLFLSIILDIELYYHSMILNLISNHIYISISFTYFKIPIKVLILEFEVCITNLDVNWFTLYYITKSYICQVSILSFKVLKLEVVICTSCLYSNVSCLSLHKNKTYTYVKQAYLFAFKVLILEVGICVTCLCVRINLNW